MSVRWSKNTLSTFVVNFNIGLFANLVLTKALVVLTRFLVVKLLTGLSPLFVTQGLFGVTEREVYLYIGVRRIQKKDHVARSISLNFY